MKRVISFFLVLALLMSFGFPAVADELEDAKKKKEAIDSSINALNQKKKELSSAIKSTNEEKKYIESKLNQKEEDLKEKEDEIKSKEEEINLINQELKVSDDNYNRKKELFKTRLKVMYENSTRTYLGTLLQSRSISDFFARLELIKFISKRDKQLIQELKAEKEKLEQEVLNKEDEKKQKLEEADKTKETIDVLDSKVSRAESTIREYNKKLKQLEDLIDKQNKLAAQQAQEIYKLQKRGTKYAGGNMLWPLSGYTRISSYYGMRVHPILKKRKLHTGIDMSAPIGTPIRASNSGTVIISGWNDAYGYNIVIDHGGGIATRYAHASKLLVKVGARVKKGQTIAKVGSTGYSTGPHLHFEVIKNGVTVDPTNYVSP